MALKVELKPHERVIIGTVVIRNGDSRANLVIEGHAPILREKDILGPTSANSPAKLIYLCVQLMYLDGSIDNQIADYSQLMRDYAKAAPSARPLLQEIDNLILSGEFYKGLKQAKKLIEHEQGIIAHAASAYQLRQDGQDGPQSART